MLSRRTVLGGAATALLATATAPDADAHPRPDQPSGTLEGWLRSEARPIRSTELSSSLRDLQPLRAAVASAAIVGLGESVHDARQQTDLKGRAVRVLVEQLHFRTLAWEEDWTTGVMIDRYLTTGRGDPVLLVRQMTGQWRSRQTVELLRRLRAFNLGRSEPVRFLGVEYYYTSRLAYDAVDTYVARAAPRRLSELRRHLREIYPTTNDPVRYVDEYTALTDKSEHVEHARKVHRLLRSLVGPSTDLALDLALHHARQILSFHEHYALEPSEQDDYREARAAENLRWWQRRSRHRIAYWAATAHTAPAPTMIITTPGTGGAGYRYAAAGSYLRQWYADRYVSVGFTLDHGAVGIPPATEPLAPPDPTWFEAPLGRVPHEHLVLDLHRSRPSPAARSWLGDPLTTRGLPWAGPDSTISGGTVGRWFDVLVHSQEVTPLDPA